MLLTECMYYPPPQIIQASRSHAAWGWGQPALGSQTFTWAMAQARLGSRGRRKIHSRLLLGHQLGRLCAKLLIVRAQQAFLTRPTQGRHCSQSDLASEEKILQHNCARLSPLPELLYGYTCVLLISGESHIPLSPVQRKSRHNIKCTVSWLRVRRCPLSHLPELKETVPGSFLMKT